LESDFRHVLRLVQFLLSLPHLPWEMTTKIQESDRHLLDQGIFRVPRSKRRSLNRRR
jgi:hypothetical protein